MPRIKFSFIPERQINKPQEAKQYTVSIYSNGLMAFNAETLNIYELENKSIKIFADIEKKSIGWSVIEGKTSLDDLNDAHQLTKNVNGCATVSVMKILRKMGIDSGVKFSKLPVKVYKPKLEPYNIYYVELEKEVKEEATHDE